MGRGGVRHALQYLHGLFGRTAPGAHPDRELLEAFAVRRDEAAFATLVERHGPLVWGVCRRILAHEQDAEDAFQATFLVLARKAGSVSWHDDIGNWLYAVALRVARRARSRRLRLRECSAVVPEEAVADPDPARAELAGLIDEEVGRLPDKYRRPVVLCCLQGLTYVEAARVLGWPEGTTSARLARAREMLRRRLTRRGLAIALPPVLVETATAVPAAVQRVTIQSAMQFVAGSLHGPACKLAEGVMRTMFQTKLMIGVAAVLALALTGVGVTTIAGGFQKKAPEEKKAPPAVVDRADEKPALPKEWSGRWVANPFAGAEWIEVEHYQEGAPERLVYAIKDPKQVAALIKAAQVIGVQHNIAVGGGATARILVHYPDRKTFESSLDRNFNLSAEGGIVYLDEAFYKALSKAASEVAMKPVNLREQLPAPMKEVVKPGVEASPKSLATGFSTLSVTCLIGRRLHHTTINDEKMLAALHKALVVREVVPAGRPHAESRNMTLTTKDGAGFYFHIQNSESIFDYNVGRFDIGPAFFGALNKEISRRAGFDIDVTSKDNQLPEAVVKRSAEFRKLLSDVKSLRLVEKQDGAEITVVVDDPKSVAEIVGRIPPVEALPGELKLKPMDRRVELTYRDGKTRTMTYLTARRDKREAETLTAVPSLSELVDVSGFGQVWVSNQWLTRLRDEVYQKQLQARHERNQETTRLVCRDLPLFFKHVISVDAFAGNTRGVLPAEAGRKVAAALASGKFEALDWSAERWQKELGEERKDDLILELSPGLGFSLPLFVKGDREVYLTRLGKLTFAENPVPAIRKVITEAFADDKDKD